MTEVFNAARQDDLFPNRETVGTENVVLMIAKFDEVKLDDKKEPSC